ncbi:MFS transporter [Neorhizobium sp. Rsf11]|uniref:MFS transporter n=2 Tax=Neorhizobium TaxID=1525371 RepID=A0ABV0MBG5_9HYPH|nr:MFS transporter [Neorhizobium petrolearium]MCC2609724.1 MFS transporter [Neorhizobium petrolearium]WGI69918.1 MFS transporter [Neorhizobium petrolearium]
MTSLPTSNTAPFFGWYVVAATFVLAIFGWGVGFYGPPIYLQMVVQRTGWSVALVSTAVTLHFLIGAAVVANLPRLYRFTGVPVLTVTGAVLLALGVVGWSVADQPWHLFAAALLSGTGWVAMGAAAVNAIIAPWFVRSRPAALSMAYNGASVGGIIFSPLWVMLIASSGFAQAAIIVGISMVTVVAALSILAFSKSPDVLGQSPDGAQSDQVVPRTAPSLATPVPGGSLWRDRRFITLAAGMAAGLFAQIGLLAHLFSIMVPVFGSQAAGLLMGGATVSAIVGRTGIGWLMPPSADRRLIASASYGVQIIGSLMFLVTGGDNAAAMVVGVLLFGLGIGNATSLPPLIAQVEFDKADVFRVVPLIVALSQATYALAPALFGIARTVSDLAVFTLAAAIQFLAVIAFLCGRHK